MNATPATAPRSAAIRLRGVTKTFGHGKASVRALRGVDIDAQPGELLVLMGPSGCGKTTLISIIAGVLDADDGTVEVFGVEWGRLSAADKTARRAQLVGFVFQQFNLIPTLSIAENVAVPLLIRRVPYAAAIRRAGDMLATVGLGDRVGSIPGDLSGGMQQRVAIARALIASPRLIVCDEPTANLDAATGHSVMQLIHDASRASTDGQDDRCVLVVTHDTRITSFADRIANMEDGRVVDSPRSLAELGAAAGGPAS